jgi:hypothetical protein
MPANRFGLKTSGQPHGIPQRIFWVCRYAVRDSVRSAWHLPKKWHYLQKDAVRRPLRMFLASIAQHSGIGRQAIQCECLGHGMSARHVCSKQVRAERLSKTMRLNEGD